MFFGLIKSKPEELPPEENKLPEETRLTVKDLQGYLYDEYNRVQQLSRQLDSKSETVEQLGKELRELRGIKVVLEQQKYIAEQAERRVELRNEEIKVQKEKVEQLKAEACGYRLEAEKLREENTKLKANANKLFADAIPGIEKDVRDLLVVKIEEMKPQASKKQIIEMLAGLSFVEVPECNL